MLELELELVLPLQVTSCSNLGRRRLCLEAQLSLPSLRLRPRLIFIPILRQRHTCFCFQEKLSAKGCSSYSAHPSCPSLPALWTFPPHQPVTPRRPVILSRSDLSHLTHVPVCYQDSPASLTTLPKPQLTTPSLCRARTPSSRQLRIRGLIARSHSRLHLDCHHQHRHSIRPQRPVHSFVQIRSGANCMCLRRIGCYGRLHGLSHHWRGISSSLVADVASWVSPSTITLVLC